MTHSRSGHIYNKAIAAKGGVEVEAREINTTTHNISAVVAASTRTDSNGYYVISGLDDAKYYSIVAKGSTPTTNSGFKEDQFKSIKVGSLSATDLSLTNLSVVEATVSSALNVTGNTASFKNIDVATLATMGTAVIASILTIGTPAGGTHKIHVYSNTGNAIISVGDNGLTQPFVYVYASANATAASGTGNIRTRSNHPLVFGANDTEFMRIHAAGGVSIGTTLAFGNNNLYVVGTMSAQVVVDRTKFFEGDALKEIQSIKADAKGGIDHSSLPSFVKVTHPDDVPGRDIGAMVSLLTVAVQQLTERMERVEAKQ